MALQRPPPKNRWDDSTWGLWWLSRCDPMMLYSNVSTWSKCLYFLSCIKFFAITNNNINCCSSSSLPWHFMPVQEMKRWQTHVFCVNRSQNSSHTRIRPRARKKRPRQLVIVLVISCIWRKKAVWSQVWHSQRASNYTWATANAYDYEWNLFLFATCSLISLFKVKISFDATSTNSNHFNSWFIPIHLSILVASDLNRISFCSLLTSQRFEEWKKSVEWLF